MSNPAMELRLQRFIDAVEVISNMSDLNNETPIAMRHQDPATTLTTTFVCSQVEPTKMVLPANVIWIVFDRNSSYYKQALKRTSKQTGSHAEFEHSWELLYFYDDIFAAQYYDPDDLGNTGTPITYATTTNSGTFKLTATAQSINAPRIISEGHYTLTDDRVPTEHSHPELPATKLETVSSFVTVADQPNPQIGMALVCDSNTTAIWRKLTESDVNMGVPN